MAIIVDKIKKRKDIAMTCKKCLIKYGYSNVSISSLTKTAGISKGSFYDYFKNKDDLLFEVINIYLDVHNRIKQKKLDSVKTAREKVKIFLEIFYEEDDKELEVLYKEFLSITLSNPSEDMMNFHSKRHEEYCKWFESIFESGIKNGELKPIARNMIGGLYVLGNGVFISMLTNNFKSKQKGLEDFIDTLFDFIEV